MTCRSFHATILLGSLFAGALRAQSAGGPPLPAGSVPARALLDSAVRAHGGPAAVGRTRRFRVALEGRQFWRHQSRRVNPPYDAEPFQAILQVDLDAGRVAWETTSRYPGGFQNHGRNVASDGKLFFINFMSELNVPQGERSPAALRNVLHRVPHLVLGEALDHAGAVRLSGRHTLSTGEPVDLLTIDAAGGALTLGLDPDSRRLRATLTRSTDPLAGDGWNESIFGDYTMQAGLLVPGSISVRTAGEETERSTYRNFGTGPVPDSLFRHVAQFGVWSQPPAPDPVRQLAPGVVLFTHGNNRSLVVEFSDHLVMIDAPRNGAPDRLAAIQARFPGKRVRYVIPTHHHDDHSTGLKPLVGAGAALLVARPAVTWYERLLRSRSLHSGDTTITAGRIEVLDGPMRIFAEGGRRLEIHRIDSPHAEDMVVAWLPGEGILFQGDLFGAAPGRVLPNSLTATTVHFAGWLREKQWSVRLHVGTHLEPVGPEVFQEVLAQPLPAAPDILRSAPTGGLLDEDSSPTMARARAPGYRAR